MLKKESNRSATDAEVKAADSDDSQAAEREALFTRFRAAANDLAAEGKGLGVAFEEAIAEIFCFMGFDAKRIGGAGETDVIVRWKDDRGENMVGIVDGKSRASGTISHGDISDIAIDTHKEKNNADFVAIVGPGFSGDAVRDYARKKGFSLLSAVELIEIARMSCELELSLQELALMFKVPDGLSQLAELAMAKQRKMDVIALVVSVFGKEQELMGGLSACDMFLLLRATALSPSLKELLHVFETLSRREIGVLKPVKKAPSAENTIYEMRSERGTVN